ncbi:MAG: FAD:protein FMN transferase [Planctomycetota bacterium]
MIPREAIERMAVRAMACRFEVVLIGPDREALCAAGEQALREIEDCERRISPFDPSSAISLVNREAAGRPVRVDSQTFEMLVECRSLWQETRGAFDVTVGAWMRARGFRGEPSREPAAGGMDQVELDPGSRTVRFRRKGIEIDLGGIGKGVALDLAAETLRESGVRCALLHGGTSTALAIGAPLGTRGFGVQLGLDNGGPTVRLAGSALSCSARRGRTKGPRSHLLDPRTGDDAPADCETACVLAASAAEADAWSTALAVDPSLAPPAGIGFLLLGSDGCWSARGDRRSAVDFPRETRSVVGPS